MPVTKEYLYEALLGHNFFPTVRDKRDDIPPLFSSEGLTPAIGDKLIAHQDSIVIPKSNREKSGYDQIQYNTTRFNNVKRLLHIPCPGPYARLCGCLRDNWNQIDWISRSSESQIKPQNHADGRVITIRGYDRHTSGRVVVMEKDGFPADELRHLEMSFGSKYLVDADVSACFPSIYTHAIPWALVGHSFAKANRSSTHWFNKIDALQRHVKRGETHGVPIGPGSSHIINEVILGKVDQELVAKGYHFIRFIDDYKCYCASRDQCDQFIRDLETEIGKYLLLLNAKKISVTELPIESKSEWVGDIASRLKIERPVSGRQIIEAMDSAVSLQRKYKNGSVIKYVARSLVRTLAADSIELFVKYLVQLSPDTPIVIPVLGETVRLYPSAVVPVDQLNIILERQLMFGRSDAAAWTLYIYGLLNAPVPSSLADRIILERDCMAMASLLAIGQHQVKVGAFVRSLEGSISYDIDQFWLLIHEQQTVITDPWYVDYCQESGLKILADESVTFLVPPTRAVAPPLNEDPF